MLRVIPWWTGTKNSMYTINSQEQVVEKTKPSQNSPNLLWLKQTILFEQTNI